MYDKLSFEVDQNDLPPQDVSETKILSDAERMASSVGSKTFSSLHDVKIWLHYFSYICNKLPF